MAIMLAGECLSAHCYCDVEHVYCLCLIVAWATQADIDARSTKRGLAGAAWIEEDARCHCADSVLHRHGDGGVHVVLDVRGGRHTAGRSVMA
jgi:hypothetical protein